MTCVPCKEWHVHPAVFFVLALVTMFIILYWGGVRDYFKVRYTPIYLEPYPYPYPYP